MKFPIPFDANKLLLPFARRTTKAFLQKSYGKSSSGSSKSTNNNLKKVLKELVPKEQKRIAAFRKEHGAAKIGDVTVNMVFGGMRGLISILWEQSVLDPNEGIRMRGKSIHDCRKDLPKASGGSEPLPEAVFWLLMTGTVPTDDQVKWLSREWAARACVPPHVMETLQYLPKELHPMAQLSAAIVLMNTESEFDKAYRHGVPRSEFWEYYYEDCMNLIGRIPVVAAQIYRNVYKDGGDVTSFMNRKADWSSNFSNMLGFIESEFHELMRLYLTIHSDHEGGNVSAHATHLVGSALSDPYLALASGINGLAGRLHGLANQEVLSWLEKLRKEMGDDITDAQLEQFITDTLKRGQVIPGYGHAVLRKTDPRYTVQKEFGLKYLPDDKMLKLVHQIYKVVPPILSKTGKVQNPWPNVDAHSGVLLQYYGLTETKFYTVLFGVSRTLGVLSALIWSRALGLPIERPKSISTEHLKKLVTKK